MTRSNQDKKLRYIRPATDSRPTNYHLEIRESREGDAASAHVPDTSMDGWANAIAVVMVSGMVVGAVWLAFAWSHYLDQNAQRRQLEATLANQEQLAQARKLLCGGGQ